MISVASKNFDLVVLGRVLKVGKMFENIRLTYLAFIHDSSSLSTRWFKRSSVETPSTLASCPKAWHRSSLHRSSSGYQWHSLDFTYWCSMARFARTLRTVGLLFQDAISWRRLRIWSRILQRLQQQAQAAGKINWDIHFVDGSVVRAHQHAAGARRGEIDPESQLSVIELCPWPWSSWMVKRWFQYQNSSALWRQWTTNNLLVERGGTSWSCAIWAVDGTGCC